jgi:amino acid adenylation domain-containing protein
MQINLLEYIEATVTRVPNKTAFADDNEALTFLQVYQQARSCGSYLIDRQLRKQPVAVFMEKGPAMAAAFFGVLYGGCYYVPLDFEIPAFRLQLILETVKPALIICDNNTVNTVNGLCKNNTDDSVNGLCKNNTDDSVNGPGHANKTVLYEDMIGTPENEAGLLDVRAKAIDCDPAYIVFTSGSTGIPKGVVASHRSVIDYIEQLTEVLRIDENTTFGNQVPLYVDACLKELYPTLKCGATTYFIPKPLFMFPVKLIEYINSHEINTVCWVVSALAIVSSFGALGKKLPSSLKTIAFGSEVFPPKQFNKWREALPDTRFVHLYGPTEATGMSAWYEAVKPVPEDGVIPVGKPFKNTEIILLTDEGRAPGDGQHGEICIRGAGLSLGYFGDAEKTAQAFMQNPLSSFPDLIYRTGDIGYLNKDGDLVFVSRRDHQIKHMGHRIELAEIEWAAARLDGVRMACAVFDGVASRIYLYCVADEGVTKKDITDYCKQALPRYMTPHAVILLDRIPLTANGKMDRVALLERALKH